MWVDEQGESAWSGHGVVDVGKARTAIKERIGDCALSDPRHSTRLLGVSCDIKLFWKILKKPVDTRAALCDKSSWLMPSLSGQNDPTIA